MQQEQTKAKVIAVGDGSTGKTCILVTYTKGEFPEDYVPTIFEHYTSTIEVNKQPLLLDLWDTAGQEEYKELRNLAYPNSDVFLIVFSVVEPASYDNAIHKWYVELEKSNPDAKKVFIGNKIDMREEEKKKYKPGDKNAPVEYSTAYNEISKLGCKYVECSARTQEGLKTVFDTAVTQALKKQKDKKNGNQQKQNNNNEKGKSSKQDKKQKKESKCKIF